MVLVEGDSGSRIVQGQILLGAHSNTFSSGGSKATRLPVSFAEQATGDYNGTCCVANTDSPHFYSSFLAVS